MNAVRKNVLTICAMYCRMYACILGWEEFFWQTYILKGCATPKSRSCFVYILGLRMMLLFRFWYTREITLLIKNATLFVRFRKGTPLFGSQKGFPLCQNRNNNKTQAYEKKNWELHYIVNPWPLVRDSLIHILTSWS